MRLDTMTILCLLLFVGAMGKSAQLGLHTWLPDAMEGPTPVSALIHAATMVTAGVFMVCRLSPMFEAAPVALGFVTFIGAATCFFAATVGTCQWDIKRVIAYSTCSQLGYMFFAAGVGAYNAAMFHLFTHAFFKALLFLGAGSVIHAMHHEQDMRFYGGLRKHIPITFWAMMAGTLAITGVGIVGVFGFAGFYSKDAILEAALCQRQRDRPCRVLARRIRGAADQLLLVAADVPDLLRKAALGRQRAHPACGPPRSRAARRGARRQHAPRCPSARGTGGYHPHESPWTMLVPVLLLAVGAVFAGFAFHAPFLENEAFWNGAVAWNEHLMHKMHTVPWR
jgi:NADH-quinone oxidoreductase subunit L